MNNREIDGQGKRVTAIRKEMERETETGTEGLRVTGRQREKTE